ncbi:hypothetical protein GCM10010219_09920 [Streptomyces netropsis]|nr:hypothetical protein GCM10010219_09920 [Streptomyces netropsis]
MVRRGGAVDRTPRRGRPRVPQLTAGQTHFGPYDTWCFGALRDKGLRLTVPTGTLTLDVPVAARPEDVGRQSCPAAT